MMTKDIKDQIAGKLKEVEGKVTGDKLHEAEDKTQQAKGKAEKKKERRET